MTVLYVMKWDINPNKAEEYPKWAQSAIKRTLAVPGVVEFRAYRMAANDSQVVVTYEFSDMASWASWVSNEEAQKVTDELYKIALNVRTELWGPSPVVPDPIRPGG